MKLNKEIVFKLFLCIFSICFFLWLVSMFFFPSPQRVMKRANIHDFSTEDDGRNNVRWDLSGSAEYQLDGQSGSVVFDGTSIGAMNKVLRTELSKADSFGDETIMTMYDSYWSQEKDLFYFSENDNWTGYQDAHMLYSDDWWQSQFEKFEYVGKSEKRLGFMTFMKPHKLSAVYKGEELETLLHHFLVMSDSQIDVSDGVGTLSVYVTVPSFAISQIDFDLKSSGMTVLQDGVSKTVTDVSFQIEKVAPYLGGDVFLPKFLQKVSLISANTLMSKEDDVSKQTPEQQIVSDDKKWQAGFLKHRIYDTSVIKDNTLKITSSVVSTGTPELMFGFGSSQDVYTDWCTNRDAALTYYNSLEGLTELSVSDVIQSSIGDYPCYWYAQQYTDLEYGFVHTEYHVAVVLSNDTYLHVQMSSSVDRGVNQVLSEDILQSLFDYIWIKGESE